MKTLSVKHNSGKVIIEYAQLVKKLIIVCAVIASLPYFLGGVLIHNTVGSDGSSLILLLAGIAGIAVIAIGYWLATVISAFISGYGEMVENTAEIVTGINYLCSTKGAVLEDRDLVVSDTPHQETSRVQLNNVRVMPDAVHIENSTGVSVNCPYCRTAVPYGSNSCPNCKHPFVFVPFRK